MASGAHRPHGDGSADSSLPASVAEGSGGGGVIAPPAGGGGGGGGGGGFVHRIARASGIGIVGGTSPTSRALVVGGTSGGGLWFFIWNSYVGGSYEQIVVGMISIGIAGYACSELLRALGGFATPWIVKR